MMVNAVAWDLLTSRLLGKSDIVIGYATQSLYLGRHARKKGAVFALDRACPHVDVQQRLLREEAEKVGSKFIPEPQWFRDRQIEEYELADKILTPSRYTAESFPESLKSKIVVAPLLGRLPKAKAAPTYKESGRPFTVGVLGGQPLRKGYVYLLEAWRNLRLPNSVLKIRSSGDFSDYPRLAELVSQTPNVEIVKYVPNISEFYRTCDIFVLPSVDDGFGMALFESMACGVASITSRSCGSSELVTDGVDGLLIDSRSVEQLESAIERLYMDKELRLSIGAQGIVRVAEIGHQKIYSDALLHGLLTRTV
jgi:glycosyltransferase involved in cell wall biosynthesis